MNKDLKIIKKKYGEAMMHFCRENFSTLLEIDSLLSSLFEEHFSPSHELYKDIIKNNLADDFKRYIFNLINKENEVKNTEKTPEELLEEVEYVLYECKCEEDIQKFKKYYAKREELCTFRGGRLDSCRVFFAVKKNVDDIKRENFEHPERQDEYGTSVISIQFTKNGSNYLSIKNRYNHTVQNPDATFSNNLDNIIPGLTNSFEKFYGISQKYKHSDFEIPGYVQAEGKYYKYNYELGAIYYCPNNIIISNYEVIQLAKEKYILFDYFILDLQNKIVILYDESLLESFHLNLQELKDIQIKNIKDGKKIYLAPKNGEVIEIEIDKENNIIGYKNNNIETILDEFLSYNKKLKYIELQKVQKVCSWFLNDNEELTFLNMPNVKEICSFCLDNVQKIQKLDLPNVEVIGRSFLVRNASLKEINLPKVKIIEGDFLSYNEEIKVLNLPNVEEIGECFLEMNNSLEELNAPLLKSLGFKSLGYNKTLKKFDLSSLSYADGALESHLIINIQDIIEHNKILKK